jgi:hypothetical protein
LISRFAGTAIASLGGVAQRFAGTAIASLGGVRQR